MTLPDLAEHQRVAVARGLKALQRYGGVLLADEPGLGKSFVAAAIARQLIVQGFATEIVCPASLVRQWQGTIERFEVVARVQSHDSLSRERSVPSSAKRFLIVDEAHVFRNPRTLRYDALARRSIGSRLLLITATPLCNRAEDLAALLALLVPDDALRLHGVASIHSAFHDGDRSCSARVLAELVIRRGREVLAPASSFGRLGRIVIRHSLPEIPSLRELRFPLLATGVPRELLSRLMVRRLESSEAALAETIHRQQRFCERALDALADGRELSRRDYRELFAADDERDAMQQVLFWSLFAPEAARTQPEEIRNEIGVLARIRTELARSAGAKAELLLAKLANDSTPALVFTEAVATARSLFALLRHARRTGLATSHGSWPESAIEAFKGGEIDVLVATDRVSEGLDLQRAGIVVHYDIPWNPVRLDQRNGRAFRMGQRRPVVTGIYFVPESDGWNSGVMQIVAAKNRLRREVLDGSNGKDRWWG